MMAGRYAHAKQFRRRGEAASMAVPDCGSEGWMLNSGALDF